MYVYPCNILRGIYPLRVYSELWRLFGSVGILCFKHVVLYFVGLCRLNSSLLQGCHASGKSQGKIFFQDVRELSGNFETCQGKSANSKMSGKSQGILGKGSDLAPNLSFFELLTVSPVGLGGKIGLQYSPQSAACQDYQLYKIHISVEFKYIHRAKIRADRTALVGLEAVVYSFKFIVFLCQGKWRFCQGNVREKSGNFASPIMWQPCSKPW